MGDSRSRFQSLVIHEILNSHRHETQDTIDVDEPQRLSHVDSSHKFLVIINCGERKEFELNSEIMEVVGEILSAGCSSRRLPLSCSCPALSIEIIAVEISADANKPINKRKMK